MEAYLREESMSRSTLFIWLLMIGACLNLAACGSATPTADPALADRRCGGNPDRIVRFANFSRYRHSNHQYDPEGHQHASPNRYPSSWCPHGDILYREHVQYAHRYRHFDRCSSKCIL